MKKELKPYKGYAIKKINNNIYRAEKDGQNMVLVKSALEELKKYIREFEKNTF